jgi:hypothetical protein
MLVAAALLTGFCIFGPLLGWLAGLGNPIGFLGVPPWRVPESARAAARQNRVWTRHFHDEYERGRQS